MRERFQVEDITTICIYTYHAAFEHGERPVPLGAATHETADHSLPYVVSVALLDGAMATLLSARVGFAIRASLP
jgi:2-methylcitrate dehydratase